ncbi:MAG: polyphosphate polymerase domain-containing protein [Clostridia bacterium]
MDATEKEDQDPRKALKEALGMITVFRKEIKYILPRGSALRIQQKLEKVMARDRNGDHGTYFIRSQYYDSLFDRDLRDNLEGLYEKRKIRLRIYSLSSDTAKLEYKCKNGTDSVKYSLTIRREEALRMEQGDVSFLLGYDNELAMRLYMRMTEGTYRPKTIIEYHRLAFAYPAGDVRVTFDTDIRGSAYAYGLFEDINTDALSNTEQILMEVKYTGFLPDEISWILKEADRLPTSNSKYSIARMAYL